MPVPDFFARCLGALAMVALLATASAQDDTPAPATDDTASTQDDTDDTADAVPPPPVVVDGQPISRAVFDTYAEQRSAQLGDPTSPEVRNALIDELIIQQLLVTEAQRRELLAQDPQLQLQYRNLMATAAVRRLMQDFQPDPEAIQNEYQAIVADHDAREFKASHILVETEENARQLITELDQGAEFDELARTHSTDSSSSQGGDLGWFTADVMVRDFSQAVAALDKGGYTEEPVQTEFGWHVILLEDVREAPPPPLEELRAGIVQQLQGRMINDYLMEQRAQATIETNQP